MNIVEKYYSTETMNISIFKEMPILWKQCYFILLVLMIAYVP